MLEYPPMLTTAPAPSLPVYSRAPWRYAIVVGASSGIGESIVRRLAEAGCRVAAVARRGDRLRALADELNRRAGAELVFAVTHDVRNGDEVPALLQEIAARLGGLDLVVYNAAVMPAVEDNEYDFAKERLMVEVNVLGALAWLGPVAERFTRARGGTIVGVSSIAGDRGRRGNPVYGTTKAALNTYLEGLRNRTARHGVNVVTVKPGFVDTDMTRGKPGLLWLISADEAARQILRAAEKKKVTAYVPARWAVVGFVVRSLPSVIFRRLNV